MRLAAYALRTFSSQNRKLNLYRTATYAWLFRKEKIKPPLQPGLAKSRGSIRWAGGRSPQVQSQEPTCVGGGPSQLSALVPSRPLSLAAVTDHSRPCGGGRYVSGTVRQQA